VEYGVSAFFVKVVPGEQVHGEIRLPKPINEWNAYFLPNKEAETELVTVKQIVLTVEVIPQSKATRVEAAKAEPGYWEVDGPCTKTTCLLTVETPLSVRRRLDEFPRP
jgi:hypothetical protein